jgi:hypothetical protein
MRREGERWETAASGRCAGGTWVLQLPGEGLRKEASESNVPGSRRRQEHHAGMRCGRDRGKGGGGGENTLT